MPKSFMGVVFSLQQFGLFSPSALQVEPRGLGAQSIIIRDIPYYTVSGTCFLAFTASYSRQQSVLSSSSFMMITAQQLS